MSQDPYGHALREAINHHREGRVADAETAYRRAIALRPNDPDPLQLLGVLIAQRGRADEGTALIRQAIAMSPGKAGYYGNLGYVLASSGRQDEAIAAFAQAVSLDPQNPGANLNLAHALREAGRLGDAVDAYREAFSRQAPSAEMLHALGAVLRQLRRLPEAIDCYAQAVRLRPDVPELLSLLCSTLSDAGQLVETETHLRQVLVQQPDHALAWFKLGNLYHGQQRYSDAIDAYRKCLAIEPSIAARHNLGSALREAQRPLEAIEEYQMLIGMGHKSFELRRQMAQAFWDINELEQAAAWFSRALELKPDPEVESGMILTRYFLPDIEPDSIRAGLAHWNQTYVRPLAGQILPHANDPTPNRRLRIGYVARHLGDHPIGRFLLPLLSHHDHQAFEVFCYCDDGSDPIGLQLQARVDVWRGTPGMSDEQLASQIRADGIDILVDLMMHCGANRLMTFARKPAPVQVAYLAYPGSTGLETMDYRLSDPYLDSPEPADNGIEKTVRLPRTFWCYLEPSNAPPVGPLPADRGDGITFGCLNSSRKVNERVIALWSQVLSQTPGSRLTLFAPQGPHRERASKLFASHGVDVKRVNFIGTQSPPDYFAEYNRIDIALDPFPYPGGTTSCDALWMGVPVITLGGQTPLSRGGVSILSNVGLKSLVTWQAGEYAEATANLARDLPTLRLLRSTLRGRMRQSPLMNGVEFAQDVEAAYRTMWRNWCTGHTQANP